MIRRAACFVVFALALGFAAAAEPAPRLFPLPGLPDAMVPFRYAVNEPNGLLVVSALGVAVPQGSAWRYVPPPGTGAVLSAVDHPLGLIAGFTDGGMLYDGKAWRRLPIEGLASGRVHRLGDAVFISTNTGVYRVDAGGDTSRVLAFPKPVAMSLIYQAEDEMIVLTQHPRGAYVWDGSSFHASPRHEALMREDGPVLFLSREGRAEGVFFDGEKCRPRAPAEVSEEVLRRITATFRPLTPFTRPVLGGGYFYGVSSRGVEGYSLRDGSLRLVITNTSLGAEISSVAWGPEGLIVVAASRVFALPDPDYVAYGPTPPSGVFYQRIDTPQGRLVLNLNGPHYEDGRPAKDLPTQRPLAGLQTTAGELVLADMEAVYWGPRRVPVPDLANGAAGMLALSDKRVLVIPLQGLAAVDADGTVHRASSSIAKIDYLSLIEGRPEILVVTRGEAVVLATDDLRELRRFGRGVVAMLTSESGDGTRLVTADGVWYSPEGEVALRRPWPFRTLLAWRAIGKQQVAYGILPDGRRMAAVVDLKTGAMRPLDLPMHAMALNVVNDDERLSVIFPGEKMTVLGEPRALTRPDTRASLWCEGKQLEDGAELPTDNPEVELRMPRARVVPWTNPIFQVKIGEGAWRDVVAGAVVPVPRLAFGRTTIRVRAVDGALESENEISIRHRWPWWARWPGWTLGAGLVLGLAYGFSVLHVRQIARRNRELEALVAERTRELVIARRKSEEASAVKGEFIASINHEIRNPMNGIVGLVRILREYEAGARWQVLLGTLEACTEQLRVSLDDVLDFNQIERGQITLQAAAFDWGRLLQSCRAALDADGTTILLEVPEAPLAVIGDAGKVRQIVTNFLSNALKYGDPPGATLRLRLEPAEEGTRRAVIEVVSRGRTLSEAERHQLFSLFYRGSRARETNAPGTGLGLALCRRFAEAMGGKVGVNPAPEGNLFWLELALPAAAEAEPETSAKPMADLRGRLVLAIEDENYNRLVLDHYLKRQGIRADWAATAADAVELIKSQRPYQAVLTDWFLPDADGTRLLQLLREARGGSLPPVVAMTAYATQEKRAEILAAGVMAFVSKPVDDRKLAATLQAVLGGTPQIEDLDETSDDAAGDKPSAGDSLRIDRLNALGEPSAVIGRFVQDFGDAWEKIVRSWREQPPTAAADAHRLRTQALLVEAKGLSRQLGLLELALADPQRASDAGPLIDEIGREVTRVLNGVTTLAKVD